MPAASEEVAVPDTGGLLEVVGAVEVEAVVLPQESACVSVGRQHLLKGVLSADCKFYGADFAFFCLLLT